jgi:hypothetical protein
MGDLMRNLSVDLKNCYGIKRLQKDFVFNSTYKTHLVYAPNGAMKTSFANVFQAISKGECPIDRIFPSRPTACIVTADHDELVGDKILIIAPYGDRFQSQKTSTLLANKELKEQHEKINETINKKKEQFLAQISKKSGLKSGVEDEFVRSFSPSSTSFLAQLEAIEKEIAQEQDLSFEDVRYSLVFNDKVEKFLESPEIRREISEYVSRYNELLESSTFFKKGVFNHNNAADVCNNLAANGFFEASHSVNLNKDKNTIEILTKEDMERVIEDEKNNILSDPDLKSKFEIIDKAITKNQDLKTFRNLVDSKQKIIPELENLASFKRKLWISYIRSDITYFKELMSEYKLGKEKIKLIVQKARKETTTWDNVVQTFNKRFFVPFKIKIANKDDVILNDKAPAVAFDYEDGQEKAEIATESKLLEYVSTGEERALYLLNIIFEVEARKQATSDTLLIIDDIADSFDYRNKYAIIEYLRDIQHVDQFYMIILTHNFDFFRTVQSRLGIDRNDHCHMTLKDHNSIELKQAQDLDPINNWKKILRSTNGPINWRIIIGCIPFVRNLIHYTDDGEAAEYLKLTSLLHIKEDSRAIAAQDIQQILNGRLNLSLDLGDDNVLDRIFSEAEDCLTDDNCIRLENKVILSIAIRLRAEDFMIKEINDQSFVSAINSNQTRQLTDKYKSLEHADDTAIGVLEKVNLMTPENLHMNTFMYEPLVDLADDHLKQLYRDIKNLGTP